MNSNDGFAYAFSWSIWFNSAMGLGLEGSTFELFAANEGFEHAVR